MAAGMVEQSDPMDGRRRRVSIKQKAKVEVFECESTFLTRTKDYYRALRIRRLWRKAIWSSLPPGTKWLLVVQWVQELQLKHYLANAAMEEADREEKRYQA